MEREHFFSEDSLREQEYSTNLGALVSVVGHDMRNFLGVLKASIYNLKSKTAQQDDWYSHIDNMEKKIASSEKMLDSISKFSTIPFNNKDGVDLADVVDKAIAACREREGFHKMTCRVKDIGSKENRLKIKGDRMLLLQFFIHLFLNSCEALPDKKNGTIFVSSDLDLGRNVCRIQVEDDCGGMSEDVLSGVRNDCFFSTKKGPCGLGIATCRYIAGLHGGALSFRSRKGVGTKVTLELPSE